MTRAATAIRCDQLEFRYGSDAPAMQFDCVFEGGAVTALMGPSGSGKSTLVALLAGFEAPSSGRILIGDEDISALSPAERPISLVFQDNNLFAHLSVGDNVGLGLSPSLRLDGASRDRRDAALERVGLAGYAERRPGELSGGERQRVALSRALVRDRPVLILDEAFGSLGPALRDTMLDLVAELQVAEGLTVIMVTHTPDDARRIASRVIFITDGMVRLQGVTADVLDGDDNDIVGAYLGHRSHV